MYSPHDWDGGDEHHHVTQDIGDGVPDQEGATIDTDDVGLKRVPVGADGSTLEDAGQEIAHEPQDDVDADDMENDMIRRTLEDAQI